MNTELEVLHSLRDKVEISQRGLKEKTPLTDKEFTDLFKSLSFANDSMLFLLGDYLNIAEKRYGEKYKSLVEQSGYAVTTLQTAKWVTKNIPLEQRHKDLSYSHHYEALLLSKSMEGGPMVVTPAVIDATGKEITAPVYLFQVSARNYLNKAAQENMSVAKMRKFVRQTMAGKSGSDTNSKSDNALIKSDKAFTDVLSYIQYLQSTISATKFTPKQTTYIKAELTRLINTL